MREIRKFLCVSCCVRNSFSLASERSGAHSYIECQFHYLTDIVKLVCLQHISFISNFFSFFLNWAFRSFYVCSFLWFSYILWAVQLALTQYCSFSFFSNGFLLLLLLICFAAFYFFLLFIFARFRHKPNKKIEPSTFYRYIFFGCVCVCTATLFIFHTIKTKIE